MERTNHLCVADEIELRVREMTDNLLTIRKQYISYNTYYMCIPLLIRMSEHDSIHRRLPSDGEERIRFFPEAKDYAIAFCKSLRGELWLNGRRPTSVASAIVFLTAGLYYIDATPSTIAKQFVIGQSAVSKTAEQMLLSRVPLPYGDEWNEDGIKKAQSTQAAIVRECNYRLMIFNAAFYDERDFNSLLPTD